MFSNKGKPCNSVPSDSQAKEKLALYVYEYLLHVGAKQAAQTFLSEIRWEKNITLGEPPGFLHCWWSVFWDLYCAAPERRDSCDHSPEAKAFHDYTSLNPTPNGAPPSMLSMPSSVAPPQSGPDGIPVSGPPPHHPLFYSSHFPPRSFGSRPPLRGMPQQMSGPGSQHMIDPTRPDLMAGPHGNAGSMSNMSPRIPVGLPPRTGSGGPALGSPAATPGAMLSPQFIRAAPSQNLPPSAVNSAHTMSPRPWNSNSRISPGPNGPGTPGSIMQPSPQPMDCNSNQNSEVGGFGPVPVGNRERACGSNTTTSNTITNSSLSSQNAPLGSTANSTNTSCSSSQGGGPGGGVSTFPIESNDPMQQQSKLSNTTAVATTTTPAFTSLQQQPVQSISSLSSNPSIMGGSAPPPTGSHSTSTGDTMESAAILKIKESMQEEAKQFEKPDESGSDFY